MSESTQIDGETANNWPLQASTGRLVTVAYAEGGQGGHGPLQWLRQKWGRGKKEMFAVKLAGKFWASEIGLYLHVYINCLYTQGWYL